jgi:hypothetical protein
LGGCAAVVLVLAGTGREAVVTEADPSNMVQSSKESAASSAPPAEESEAAKPQEQASTATVGGSITLQGFDPGFKVAVTLNKVVNPATGDQFSKPQTGNKFVAVEVTLANQGQAVNSDAPNNSGILIDGQGRQYRSSFHQVREGQGFGGMATINTGDSRKGMIVFEVPEAAKPAKFQFGPNSGFADQKGEWSLS